MTWPTISYRISTWDSCKSYYLNRYEQRVRESFSVTRRVCAYLVQSVSVRRIVAQELTLFYLCGFDTVLWRRNSKSVTVRWRQRGRLCSIMITLCLSTQTAPYNSHRRHCTADREPYSSLSTPVRSSASRLVVKTHRVKHHGVLLVQQLPKARVRALSRRSGRVP